MLTGQSLMGMGDTQSNNNAPTGFWSAVGQFFNPNISTSTLLANYYQGVQNGQIPPIPEATSTETPQQYAARVQQAITDAEAAGTYTPDPSLGVTASDLSAIPTSVYVLIGAAAIGLILAVKGR